LVPFLKFKRKRQQEKQEVDDINIQDSAYIEHHPATHNPHKREEIDIGEHRSIEKVKDDTPCGIQKHHNDKPVNHYEILVGRALITGGTEKIHTITKLSLQN